MSQQAIGKILLTPRGTYDGSATYSILDWVRYNGKAWVCKQNNTTGVVPSESNVWTMLVQDGSGGSGAGDMLKSVYDTDDDGIVDSAETLSGLTATITQLNYLNTATSDIQTQINGKATDNPTFIQADSRSNIASGESFSTLFGKIKKWFADLADLAFIAKDGVSSTKYLQGDGTWQTFPTIPTVNNGTLYLNKNGVSWKSFTANQSSDTTANIELDENTAESTATTSGNDTVVVFDNLNNDYSYILLAPAGVSYTALAETTGTQSGTKKATYTLSGATAGTTKCRLRILK